MYYNSLGKCLMICQYYVLKRMTSLPAAFYNIVVLLLIKLITDCE